MTQVTVAALQLAFSNDMDENIAAVSAQVRQAAARGAKIILPPELFEGHYFCKVEEEAIFAQACPVGEHPAVLAMQRLAAELNIYIPRSEEHTSELQSLMRISYAVFCLKKKQTTQQQTHHTNT